ncbi:hypothetical protein [Lapillicoccus jejuensis]|uniref:hypothetical protein n=1 Tax=Lapillicoccus jejuensis TaxID=402171 RepID=UPI001476C176|nr:hypothetical protein [Lapillicoccus jejuensis]
MTLDDLGLAVARQLTACWREWFAPARQPFVVSEPLRADLGAPPVTSALPLELQDTF